MTCTLHMAWNERLTDHHFGPGHPLAPVRVELTMRLAYEFGLWSQPGVTVAAPAPATDAELELVHYPPGAEGSAVNVALPARTRDASWLRAFHAIIPPLLREFRPQILFSQHGCDTHRLDPLADLELSIDAQRAAHAAIHGLAHDLASGR